MKPSDYYYCFDTGEKNFCITSKDFWNKKGALDADLLSIDCLPENFHNIMESCWEYYKVEACSNSSYRIADREDGELILQSAGFVFSKDMDEFINGR
jgi:hypothetical protein